MELNINDGKAKVLAYYLPQFYPNPFNNKWYGEGFTEWTNVGKAKKRAAGQYQPKVPADLGYYDLRVPEVADRQAELAREAGVCGFAYWHYWFGNGEMQLEMPAERMLYTLKPDFPFMFAWANESWYKKFWDKSIKNKDILIEEQKYPGDVDSRQHFDYCLPFFKDNRYLRINNRPLFMIYKPLSHPDMKGFMSLWNTWIKEEGVAESFFFIGGVDRNSDFESILSLGFDCVTFSFLCRMGHVTSRIRQVYDYTDYKIRRWLNLPRKVDFLSISKYHIWEDRYDSLDTVAPLLFPNWDNCARAGSRCLYYVNATPDNFAIQIKNVLSRVMNKKNKLVFLKSWNEWAEGNYMEPDLKYGKGFIKALGEGVNTFRTEEQREP